MIEDLGGCTGTLPLYQRAAEVGRAMELFGDRVPPETQRQVRRILMWVKKRTPAFIVRLIDMYYERTSFNAKYRPRYPETTRVSHVERAPGVRKRGRSTDGQGAPVTSTFFSSQWYKMPPRARRPGKANDLIRPSAAGVRKRGESRAYARPSTRGPVASTRSRRAAPTPKSIPLSAKNITISTQDQRFEMKLVKNVAHAFHAMPRHEHGWTRLAQYTAHHRIHAAVLATLMLKEFYATTRRKGIPLAVFVETGGKSGRPVTAKEAKDHLEHIFGLMNDEPSNEGYFENNQAVEGLGFDNVFIVPMDILDRAKRAGVTKTLSKPEQARFKEARAWLRQRTPSFVTTWVTGHRMNSDMAALSHLQAVKNGYVEPLRLKKQWFTPPGSAPASRKQKRRRPVATPAYERYWSE